MTGNMSILNVSLRILLQRVCIYLWHIGFDLVDEILVSGSHSKEITVHSSH